MGHPPTRSEGRHPIALGALLLSLCVAVAARSSVCDQPMETGGCQGAIPRWYYLASANKCKGFTYGGCEGNGNNFEFKGDCNTACVDRVVTSTIPPPTTTTTLSNFYSNTTGSSSTSSTPIVLDGIHTSPPPATKPQFPAACHEPMVVGPCKAVMQAFFYDPQANKCKGFTYGGCGGNGNNFEMKKDCNAACLNTTPPPPTVTLKSPTETSTMTPTSLMTTDGDSTPSIARTPRTAPANTTAAATTTPVISTATISSPIASSVPPCNATISETDHVKTCLLRASLAVATCGGVTASLCSGDRLCYDDPRDGCHPSMGGANCSGICCPPMPKDDCTLPSGEPPASICCPAEKQPGHFGNPIAREGAVCCPTTGEWGMSIGDAKTFICGGIQTTGPFGAVRLHCYILCCFHRIGLLLSDRG